MRYFKLFIHTTRVRLLSLCFVALLLITLFSCGGHSAYSGSVSSSTTTSNPASNGGNVQPITVIGGPSNSLNMIFTSVTICTPGSTTQCQTIDNIQVDTGSYGLRVMASALNGAANLTPVISENSQPLLECGQFADGFVWGPVKHADIQIAGESAANVPIQIIGDSNYSSVPTTCSNTGTDESSVASFGANGVLGVGPFVQDCGPGCASVAQNNQYFDCLDTVCSTASSIVVALLNQVRNPIGDFAVDNNGVIINMPSVPSQGAAVVSGSMIFGIGTQSNNTLGSAQIYDVDPNLATFTTLASGQTFAQSFADTGSSQFSFPTGTAFPASELPTCTAPPAVGFYCPASPLEFNVTIQAYSNGNNASVNFTVGNADTMLSANPDFYAFSEIAAPDSATIAGEFDWGLPFFYGRQVYTALENSTTPYGAGPYIAF